MPNLDNIASVAEAFEKSPLLIVQDRCVAVRNRNATCRRCGEACSVGAIDVTGNEVIHDALSCVACGACVTVCPTEAIALRGQSDAELAQSASEGVIACARIASKRQVDPERFAEVPCLARIDESLLLALVADGNDEILLVDGNCASCKLRECAVRADAVIDDAQGLIAAHGRDAKIRRMTGFPEHLRAESAPEQFGTTRRGFLSEAVGAARDTAMTAAKASLEHELGLNRSAPAIGERLRVTGQGTLPLIEVPRHDVAINALYELGEPIVEHIESRLFGSVEIIPEKCNVCGMCAVFCPTGALRRALGSKPDDPLTSLEFSASECVQCGLCVDVCWKGAVKLTSSVSTSQLYDFEPVEFDLTNAKRPQRSLFG